MFFQALILALFVSLLEAAHLPDPPVFTATQHYPAICYLPPESGLCASQDTAQELDDDRSETRGKLLTRFYFDTATQQCYAFGVQNCGGNANNFPSLAACQAYCHLDK